MAFALKEWSVVCDALLAGEQIMTLRKGGIEEEEGEFKAVHDVFYLYPTFEHQNLEALRPEVRERLDPHSPVQPLLKFQGYAYCVGAHRVATEADARRLAAETIWTEEAMGKRFHLYPNKPLVMIELRVFRLPKVLTLPEDLSYAGCRSWVPLVNAPDLPVASPTPVLSDEDFESKRRRLHPEPPPFVNG